MVSGKVKAAMGLKRSSATPKREKAPSCPPAAAALPLREPASTNAKAAAFARSFGVYFPRTSSQVQPRPPDSVADLLRLVEELREKESRLQTQLLEHKILKETVAVVPFLESEITSKNDDLNRSRETIQQLEAENEALQREVGELRSKIRSEEEEGRRKEEKVKEMAAELEELRRRALSVDFEECSSSQRFQGLIDASARSNLLKNLRKGSKSTDIASNQEVKKAMSSGPRALEEEAQQSLYRTTEELLKPRGPRIPIPPPTPSLSSNPSSFSSTSSSLSPSLAGLPPIPPLPPPADGQTMGTAVRVSPLPPPPPPPPPPKGRRFPAACVRRVPEVVEFYHSLMRRESRRESSGGGAPEPPPANNARDMIGEIENRSAYLLAIKTDVETQGDFIRFLIKEVENAAFTNIEDVVAFVNWLDEELSFLVDERAVLKHFEWPEHKADAMREAAFGYCDLKKLESEAASFRDDPRLPYPRALKKMQALLEKLEQEVYNLSRVRDSARKRCEGLRIPWEWMLDTGIVSQIKLASVKLAMKYMKRVSSELEAVADGPEEEELMLQGVRFAFRVHQFAGGFDVDTMRAFQELKDKAHSLQIQSQSQRQRRQQQQHKLFCRSTTY